ncbi:MAG: EamA/RhaT family transporter [Ilumatobacteraceae bacterium]|nr:EamA/RhaT family transporter [Ilumatobacteraceae bacterium]
MSSNTQPTTTDWLRLVTPGLIWGTSFFFIAEGLKAFPAIMITPMRIAFGFAALACVPASRTPVPRSAWPRIITLAAVWMAVPLSMFPFAEERVSSSVTGMLNGATPLFVATVGALAFKKKASRAQVNGLLVGFAGVVVIAVPTFNEGSSSIVGIALIVAALTCYGFSLNVALPLQQAHGSLPVLWRAQAAALVMTTPLGLTGINDIDFAWSPLVMIVLLGVFGTGLAYVMTVSNAGRLGATRASVTTYLIPVVALALGALIRNESVEPLSILGCAIALVGAYLAGRSS